MTAKLTIDRAALEGALHVAASATGRDGLLACALLHAEPRGSSATLTATDLTTSITVEVHARVESPRPVLLALPVRELAKAAHLFPPGPLVMELGLDGAETRCALYPDGTPRDRYRFLALPGRDFPAMPLIPADMQEVDGKELRRLLETCRPACSTDDTRPGLQSVLLAPRTDTAGGGALVACATDGHRMHVATSALRLRGLHDDGVVLPVRAVDALLRLLDDRVRVAFLSPWVFATAGDVLLVAKIHQSAFPPWEQVMPPAAALTVEVDARALASAAARVGLVATAARGAHLTLSGGVLTLVAADETGREMTAQVDVPDGSGVELDVLLSPRYLWQALDAMDAETVILQPSADALQPFLLADKGGACSAVVMPMRRVGPAVPA